MLADQEEAQTAAEAQRQLDEAHRLRVAAELLEAARIEEANNRLAE